MSLLEEVREFVRTSFDKIGKPEQVPHLIATEEWLLKLRPDADEALRIAAVSHDIERAYPLPSRKDIYSRADSFQDSFFTEEHPMEGGRLMEEFLTLKKAAPELIERVKRLIERHELGGDTDSDLLKDADSLSFFEHNAERFATKYAREHGEEKSRGKLEWMFERITDPRAKEWAKPMHERALAIIDADHQE